MIIFSQVRKAPKQATYRRSTCLSGKGQHGSDAKCRQEKLELTKESRNPGENNRGMKAMKGMGGDDGKEDEKTGGEEDQ